jgi:signal transduction histidine kinase
VNEVLESAALLCYDMAASKGLELSWFVEPSLPPALLIDATRLQQVLLNMLSNAIKVSRRGVDATGGGQRTATLVWALARASSCSALLHFS